MTDPESVLPAPSLEFAMLIRADLAPPEPVGTTADGVRTHIPIVGGTVTGPRITGTLLPGPIGCWSARTGSASWTPSTRSARTTAP